ncbi:MAG: antibiotic biosynthesis monooxygenase [Desulfocapsaceae bacterium]
MIIARTYLNALQEKQKEVMQTLLSMVEPPKNGNGLISYAVYRDIEDKNAFNLISSWETRDHLNRHLSSERFGVLLGIKSLLSHPIEIEILTILAVEGMEAVKVARNKET